MSVLERELKLAIDHRFDPGMLNRATGEWTIEAVGSEQLDATYYDTADLRLLRGGMWLRFCDGWMVKLGQPSDRAGLLQRTEIAIDGGEDVIPDRALDLVRSAVRRERVCAIARLSTARRVFAVTDDTGHRLAQVVLDRVGVDAPERDVSDFAEVEVELAVAVPIPALGSIVGRLREAGAGDVVRVPKLARALGLAEAPSPEVVVPDLEVAPTAGAVIRAAIARSVRRYMEHAPAVVLDEDPEGVHQARVATRRLRSDLRTFRRFLDRDWADALRADLRPLTDLLGSVRDLDVLAARLGEVIKSVSKTELPAAREILESLGAERSSAVVGVVEAFRNPAYADLLDRLVVASADPRLTDRAAQRADSALFELARKPWLKLQAAVGGLPGEPSPEELHRIRILAKRARYAAEALVPVGGIAPATFAFRLSELQDILGEHQDAVVAARWLRRRGPRHALAAGELIGFEVARANRAAGDWRDKWAAIDRRELTGWMDR